MAYSSDLRKKVLAFIAKGDSKNKADYDLIDIDDLITLDGQATLAPHSELTATVKKANGTSVQLPLVHSYAQEQVAWFKADSAMNAANQKTKATV